MSVFGLEAPKSEPWIRFWKSVMSASEIGAPTAWTSPRPVTTTVPALRIEAIAWPRWSPVMTPTVTIAESAPWPLVTDWASSVASSMVATAWVAPSSSALVRLNSTGSTAITSDAPACAAPWTALMPIPPMPITITTSPGRTSAELIAEPQPVPTPQPIRQALSSGMSSCTLTAESTATVVTSAKVEMPHIWPTGWPSYESRKLVGSSQREPIEQGGAEVAEVLHAARAPGALPARRAGRRRRRGRPPSTPACADRPR